MSNLKTIQRKPFEDLFDMQSGYVANYSNATFASFFAESTGTDIYHEKYGIYGNSKAKRLRAFWDAESDAVVGKVMAEMLELWSYENPEPSNAEKVTFKRCEDIVANLRGNQPQPNSKSAEVTESQFMRFDFSDVKISDVPIEASLIPILESRFQEAVRAMNSACWLSTIFMCGSILEGMLLGMALANPRDFNQSASSPKDKEGKVRPFPEWSLAQLIDVSCQLGHLKIDIKKFSHGMRDFRNYIHPFQQMSSQFSPDEHTAQICMQVLRAAIASLCGARK